MMGVRSDRSAPSCELGGEWLTRGELRVVLLRIGELRIQRDHH